MSIEIVIAAIILLCVFGLIAKRKNESDPDDTKKDNEENDFDNNYNEAEEAFFSEVSNGKIKYRFLKIDNQFDLMFIKSMFHSENIPYYIEFEHISQFRPGMLIGDLGNYIVLYILDEDYHDALELVKDYLNTKKKNTQQNNIAKNLRNTAEILLGNWKVPSSGDTNGIQIIYKENDKPKKKIKKIDDEIDISEIGSYTEKPNNDGDDFKHGDKWVCSKCGSINEMYLIECKHCGKILD